jgi:hypothetical protein
MFDIGWRDDEAASGTGQANEPEVRAESDER